MHDSTWVVVRQVFDNCYTLLSSVVESAHSTQDAALGFAGISAAKFGAEHPGCSTVDHHKGFEIVTANGRVYVFVQRVRYYR